MSPLNALSIDLEFWHTAELLKPYIPANPDDLVLEAVHPLLSLLDAYETKATFFIVGALAASYPELIREIHGRGHEIACHGYSHARLGDLGEAGFRQEIARCGRLFEGLTGEPLLGFRAPTFSLEQSTSWALTVLQEAGYRYDSSIFPVRTPLYGVAGAPLRPYRPDLSDLRREQDGGDGIWEFPVAVFDALGVRLPVGGAFYLRLLPAPLVSWAIGRLNAAGAPAILYFHPWEGSLATPVVTGASPYVRFVTYWGRAGVWRKLEHLLRRHRFGTMRRILAQYETPGAAP